MAHTHTVKDTDTLFVIDPITRAVVNAESKKTMLMQYDHNSETFTFEIPRYVEEHDMSLCNRVEIHYNNIEGSTRAKNSGVYEVQDLTITGDKVTFSWLISENATFLAGSLSFLILFACVEDGVTTYRWNTNINNSITISSGIDNSGAIAEVYPDILAQWKEELFSTNLAYEAALENGFEGSITDWLDSLKGEPGVSDVFIGFRSNADGIPTNDNVLWCASSSQVQTVYGSIPVGRTDILFMASDSNGGLALAYPRTNMNSIVDWPDMHNSIMDTVSSIVNSAKTDLNQSWGVSLGEAKNELNGVDAGLQNQIDDLKGVDTDLQTQLDETNTELDTVKTRVGQISEAAGAKLADHETRISNIEENGAGSNIQLTTEDPGVGATSEFADGTIIAVYE